MTNDECSALDAEALERGRAAVEATVADKIANFLGSAGKAERFALR
jgi:fructose-bisphosphate aldolase class II